MELPRTAAVPPAPHTASGMRSAPFSAHSRGVQLLDVRSLLDVHAQLLSAVQQVRDISTSFLMLALIQPFLSLVAVLVQLGSVSFFTYGTNSDQFKLDFTYVLALIVLPVLFLLHWVFSRREAALRDLAEVKGSLTLLYNLHKSAAELDDSDVLPPSHLVHVQWQLCNLMDAMRAYLTRPRYYASSYPVLHERYMMVQVAKERAQDLRQIAVCTRRLTMSTAVLYAVGISEAVSTLRAISVGFERMQNVKEFRTPQPIRALLRPYIIVVFPVYVGPYWASFAAKDRGCYAFVVCLSMLLALALVVLLNAAVSLEDPFDNVGLDGIYIDEAWSDVQQAMMADDGEVNAHKSAAVNTAWPAALSNGMTV